MSGLAGWAAALAAAGATATLLLRPHPPRRFPEDEVHDARSARRSASPSTRSARHSKPLPSPLSGPAVRPVPSRRLRRPRGPWPRARTATSSERAAEAQLGDLASCCDLLAVAAASGSTVAGAVEAVGAVGTGPVARALGGVAEAIGRGSPLVDALAVLPRQLGSGVQPLVTTLSTAAGAGTPPAPALVRLADAERRRARRRVEARIRRLPVLLLLPLVGLILPAFVLLTLVPVALSAAQGADLATPRRRPAESAAPLPPLPPPVPSSSSGDPL